MVNSVVDGDINIVVNIRSSRYTLAISTINAVPSSFAFFLLLVSLVSQGLHAGFSTLFSKSLLYLLLSLILLVHLPAQLDRFIKLAFQNGLRAGRLQLSIFNVILITHFNIL